MNPSTIRNAVFSGALALVATKSIAAPSPGTPPPPAKTVPLATGDSIVTTRPARVWVTPPTAGAYAGEQPGNATGRIVGGPVRAAGASWWKVDFDTNVDGWTIDRDLRRAGAPPAAAAPPVVTGTSGPGATFSGIFPRNDSVVNTPRTLVSGRIVHDIYGPSQIKVSLNGGPVLLDAQGFFSASIQLNPGINTLTLVASTPNPRQQVNQIPAFLDASMIYGSNTTRASALRTFVGGKLKTSPGNLPPLNTAGLENANDAHLFPDNQLFLAGDIRANENIELTAIHTLFVREHNLLATAIAASGRGLSDEQIYQQARRIVTAEIQVITFQEFLPALLGPGSIRPYAGYKSDVNAGISTEFSTAAFRIGHTMINDDVEFLNNEGEEIRNGLPLASVFFNPKPLQESGPDPLLKYLATDNAQEIDTQIVDGLRDFLFGPPGAGGLDLASLNIQRGRDHGLADYNSVRRALGLPAAATFAQVTSNSTLQQKLSALYGTVDTLDLWVGGLAEDHVPGSSVGPTFQRILAEQFERTRDGDRNWYERSFSGRQLAALRATRLSAIIRRNTSITKLQDNVFFFDPDSTLAGLNPHAGSLPPDLIEKGPAGPVAAFASLDGKGNNPAHPSWGSAGADLVRLSPAAYGDGAATPSGVTRPGARLISNSVSVLTTPFANDRLLSSWVYGWGQFIDHDLDLTITGDTAYDIPVPAGDPSFDPAGTGTASIPFSRSTFDPTSGSASPSVTKLVQKITFNPPPRR